MTKTPRRGDAVWHLPFGTFFHTGFNRKERNSMKRLFCMLCALMATFAVLAQQLPDVQVENAEGRMISVRSLVGEKPLIIAYWSITCKPCIQELNAINDQIEEWREEADFDVLAVSVDDVRMKATAKAKAASLGWDFICVFDENQDLKRGMNVSLTPQSFVVDKQGKVVYSHSGYTPGSELELLEQVLKLQ